MSALRLGQLSTAFVATGLLAFAELSLSCGGTTDYARPTDRTLGLRPGWTRQPNRQHPDVLYVTASCRDQPSLAAGKTCALADGQRQVAEELGSTTVEVAGRFVEAEYSEIREAAAVGRSRAGRVYDVWLLIAYPRGSLACAKARVAGRVQVGLVCETEPATLCRSAFAGDVERALTEAGFAAAPQRLSAAQTAALLADPRLGVQHACAAGAAHVLAVRLSATFTAAQQGEFYAHGRASFRLFDAAAGKVVAAFETGEVKRGAYDHDVAVGRALSAALADLVAAIPARLPRGGVQ